MMLPLTSLTRYTTCARRPRTRRRLTAVCVWVYGEVNNNKIKIKVCWKFILVYTYSSSNRLRLVRVNVQNQKGILGIPLPSTKHLNTVVQKLRMMLKIFLTSVVKFLISSAVPLQLRKPNFPAAAFQRYCYCLQKLLDRSSITFAGIFSIFVLLYPCDLGQCMSTIYVQCSGSLSNQSFLPCLYRRLPNKKMSPNSDHFLCLHTKILEKSTVWIRTDHYQNLITFSYSTGCDAVSVSLQRQRAAVYQSCGLSGLHDARPSSDTRGELVMRLRATPEVIARWALTMPVRAGQETPGSIALLRSCVSTGRITEH